MCGGLRPFLKPLRCGRVSPPRTLEAGCDKHREVAEEALQSEGGQGQQPLWLQ